MTNIYYGNVIISSEHITSADDIRKLFSPSVLDWDDQTGERNKGWKHFNEILDSGSKYTWHYADVIIEDEVTLEDAVIVIRRY